MPNVVLEELQFKNVSEVGVNCKLDLLLATVWAEGGSVTPSVIGEYGKTCTLEGLLPISPSINPANAEAAMGTKRLTSLIPSVPQLLKLELKVSLMSSPP